MSRHIFKPEQDVEIHMGFDKPLQRLYMTIFQNPEEENEQLLYDDLNDPLCSTFTDHLKPVAQQLQHFQVRIQEVGKGEWNVPDQLFVNVIDDSFYQRVNAEPKYY